MVFRKHLGLVFVLLLLPFSFYACTGARVNPIQLQQNEFIYWGELETDAVFDSQLLDHFLLASTDRGLAGFRLDTSQPEIRWLHNSKDKIVSHTISSVKDSKHKKYYYLEKFQLKFFDIEATKTKEFPTIHSKHSISTKRFGGFLDGVNPSRHVFSPDGSKFYVTRYGQLLLVNPEGKTSNPFILPNFVSYFEVDNEYFYYRTFERKVFSSHIFAAVDMNEAKELWRTYYGPNHQSDLNDIADSFPVLDNRGNLYFIVRAYPTENYEEKGIVDIEHIDRESGIVLNSLRIETVMAAGKEIPIGPVKIVDQFLIGEIHSSSTLSLLDLSSGEIAWTTELNSSPLDLAYSEHTREWAALLSDGSVVFIDAAIGKILRKLPPAPIGVQEYSYGRLHLLENGGVAGHLNNRAAYTSPRAIIFFHP